MGTLLRRLGIRGPDEGGSDMRYEKILALSFLPLTGLLEVLCIIYAMRRAFSVLRIRSAAGQIYSTPHPRRHGWQIEVQLSVLYNLKGAPPT